MYNYYSGQNSEFNFYLEKEYLDIKVPATSANLGAGFDCFGLALRIYNHYRIYRYDDKTHEQNAKSNPNSKSDCRKIIWQGQKLLDDEHNLVANTINDVLEMLGKADLGYEIHMLSQDIPVSRGLGSSAAAIVSGVIAAFWIAHISTTRQQVSQIATQIEGHPDNVCACVYGGFTLSKFDENSQVVINEKFPQKISILLMYPDFELSTAQARGALPKKYELKDVVCNLSNAAIMIKALNTGDYELFKIATGDELHEKYRLPLIDKAQELIQFVGETSGDGLLSTNISGAGSTLISFFKEEFDISIDELIKKASEKFTNWTFMRIQVDESGAMLE